MIKGIWSKENSLPKYYYKLQENKYGISLDLVDEQGNMGLAGHLLSINSDTGHIRLDDSISKEFKFDLSPEGKLKVEDY